MQHLVSYKPIPLNVKKNFGVSKKYIITLV